MKKKLGLLAIPVVLGLGAVGYLSTVPAAHAAPAPVNVTNSSAPAGNDTETADTPEVSGASEATTNKTDAPGGPDVQVEQTGQNNTAD